MGFKSGVLASSGSRKATAVSSLVGVLAAVGVLGAFAAPAHAAYVDVTYSGMVDYVDKTGASPVGIGTAISIDVIYNLANLHDDTASVNAALHTTIFTQVLDASLSDDPFASLTIKIGDLTFTKADAVGSGTTHGSAPFPLGGQDFPLAVTANGQFGVGGVFVDQTTHDSITADPVVYALKGPYSLGANVVNGAVGEFLLSTGPTSPVAVGNFDYSTMKIEAIPEPSVWAMVVVGAGLAGAGLRARRRSMTPRHQGTVCPR